MGAYTMNDHPYRVSNLVERCIARAWAFVQQSSPESTLLEAIIVPEGISIAREGKQPFLVGWEYLIPELAYKAKLSL
jgi:hypothetical protein